MSGESATPDPDRGAGAARRPPPSPDRFRWQAFFQHTDDPLFLLNRRLRLLFVNRAWEALTGLPAARVLGLTCRRAAPASPRQSPEEVLAHVLCPPPEVLAGTAARARRLLPGREAGRRWWDVDFLPLAAEGRALTIVGRIRPVATEEPDAAAPLPERLVALRRRVASGYTLDLLPVELPGMRRLADQVRLAARVSDPVLLVGETGTGKETLARVIHQLGPAHERAFAALDCARLPPACLAHVLFESSWGGPDGPVATVYLRLPERLPRDLQARLCDLLARRDEPAPRVLAGCASDPVEEVRAGRLLEELYHALATLVLAVPPLRERLADLPWVVDRLLERGNGPGVKAVRGLLPEAWEAVRAYPWPGNLGELSAVLDAARSRAEGERIALADLPSYLRTRVRLGQTPGGPAARPPTLDQVLERVERRLLELALRRCEGNRTRAAELLGIWRPTLLRRLKALGLADAPELENEPPQA
jgi:transcriptional regulator with PAS, ATPase and Fis domain